MSDSKKQPEQTTQKNQQDGKAEPAAAETLEKAAGGAFYDTMQNKGMGV